MKYLIMTEGSCENALIDVLLEKSLLKFGVEDLLYEQVFNKRQIDAEIKVKISQLKDEPISIYRVGDKLSDKLRIPTDLKNRIVDVIDVCTKPEIEILHIIDLGLLNEYKKYKSQYKPSSFLKGKFKDYNKSYDYNYDYFSKKSSSDLVKLLKKYSKERSKTNNKNQFTLYEAFIKR